MKICIAGKNEISINAINYLHKQLNIGLEDILICVNKNDNGKNSWQQSLKYFAIKNNLKIVSLEDLYRIEGLIFISLEFDRIINPKKFITNNLFNIHFSLLPSYKGMYTSVLPILNGEQFSGVTLHEIDEGIDTGAIIDQIKFKIGLNETSRDLYFKYLKFGTKLFNKNIKSIIENKYISKPQSSIGSTYYSKQSLDFNSINIDLKRTSFQIHNQIRAFIFKEYQVPLFVGKRITQSYLLNEKIKKNYYEIRDGEIILSGIDGYKIVLKYDD